MANMARSKRFDKEAAKARRGGGGYIPLPLDVIRSPAFSALPAYAVKLLFDLLAGYSGKNNGDFSAAWSLMQKRGWASRDTLAKATKALETTGWIIRSRQGHRKQTTLYAVTFYAVDECGGKLDIKATASPLGNWHQGGKFLPPLPTPKNAISYPPTVLKNADITRPACQRT